MIILDTNVVSETMRRTPTPVVVDFLARRRSDDFALTALTLFELRFGVERLARSAERSRLTVIVDGYEAGALGPVLPLDIPSADLAATYRASRQRNGRPVGVPDSLIAGIALHHGAALATRNIRDFEGSGLDLVDPWQAASP